MSVDDGELAAEVRIAVARLSRRLRAEKASHEMSDAQFAVLALLYRDGPRTLGELAEYERVTPPSMTRTVAGLVEAGLAERLPDPRDGRVTRLRATAAGEALVIEVRRRRDTWLIGRLERLDDADRRTVERAAAILRELADR